MFALQTNEPRNSKRILAECLTGLTLSTTTLGHTAQ